MQSVSSPCIDLCRLDVAGELCVGCGRSMEEIAGWQSADDAERRAIVERAARRLADGSTAQG